MSIVQSSVVCKIVLCTALHTSGLSIDIMTLNLAHRAHYLELSQDNPSQGEQEDEALEEILGMNLKWTFMDMQFGAFEFELNIKTKKLGSWGI